MAKKVNAGICHRICGSSLFHVMNINEPLRKFIVVLYFSSISFFSPTIWLLQGQLLITDDGQPHLPLHLPGYAFNSRICFKFQDMRYLV